MDFLHTSRELAKNCFFVIWKDPTEGDGIWKEAWDGKSSININVGWMEENPNDKDDFVLYCSKDFNPEIEEKGTEIYIPKGCIIARFSCVIADQGEYFETSTTIK